jgi:hypothetical protein
MSNWAAHDILSKNRKTSHRHRSDRQAWSKDSSRAGGWCGAGMKLLFRNSIVPPRFFFNDRFRPILDGYDFQ